MNKIKIIFLYLTTAVFSFLEISRQTVRQTWNDWGLDEIFPVLYQNFYRQDIPWIGFYTGQDVSDVDFPVLPGLYAPSLTDPKELKEAIQICRENGASGVSLFTADGLSKEQQLVLVRLKSKLLE